MTRKREGSGDVFHLCVCEFMCLLRHHFDGVDSETQYGHVHLSWKDQRDGLSL